MKVNTWVKFEDEIEIDVDPTEIIRALPGCYHAGDESIFAVQRMISQCWSCLKAVPDEMIAEFSSEARRKTAEALREQAARFEEAAEPAEDECWHEAVNLPALTATRSDDEPSRIDRLRRVLWYAVGRISTANPRSETVFLSSIAGLHDHKGDLTVTWKEGVDESLMRSYRSSIEAAWGSINAGDGGGSVQHEFTPAEEAKA